ncbi:MAG: hypothetical protein RBS02_10245 [Steroidobacteraceae bacterium]|nr:hypothetical protein [Steroidobacteraceae bacterium]
MIRLVNGCGLAAEFCRHGALRLMSFGELAINLFVGSEIDGGPANLWLRVRRAGELQFAPLLGPYAGTSFVRRSERLLSGVGECAAVRYTVTLALAEWTAAWFWRIDVENTGSLAEIDAIHAQDIALAPYPAVRLNEFYVSHYVDHTPLEHPRLGWAIASRQNLEANGAHPWALIGSMRRAVSFATDALQVYGLAMRSAAPPKGVAQGLPGRRLQHEHSMAVLQDASVHLPRGEHVGFGFFGRLLPHHPQASSPKDLECVDETLAAEPPRARLSRARSTASSETLFTSAPPLIALDLTEDEIRQLFSADLRHEERDGEGRLLSFFHGRCSHVATRLKELQTLRPHGHLLRTGVRLTPEEVALTSTAWMNGVFHSMITQGHVSLNRLTSTARTYLGLFRARGVRVFLQTHDGWRLLDAPSAFEMAPEMCRWIYRCAEGVVEIRSAAHEAAHELTLEIEVLRGPPLRSLIVVHAALDGDDGDTAGCAVWRREGEGVCIRAPQGSLMHKRFPRGDFLLSPIEGASFEALGGDELLFADARARDLPYVCMVAAPARVTGLRVRGRLIADSDAGDAQARRGLPALRMQAPARGVHAARLARLSDIIPWFTHDALIHYLAPRGLEQFSGGGWGTRDVCQGPLELLLAFGRRAEARDLILRVMSAQNPEGDWPQWFMFFERDRDIRAADSHGDIVFWPVLALAQYIIASGDADLLEAAAPFHGSGESASVGEHVRRALAVIDGRLLPGTQLCAYGAGDWNDSLQPADASMREHMCSSWTVTLHKQMLTTLARALHIAGRDAHAARCEAQARAIEQDFQRWLLPDGVLAGYASFDSNEVRYLLHPRDERSGVTYSSLAMVHAILEGMLTPAQARSHLELIEQHLTGPDGLRLFDQPMPYRGGPERLFRRAESAAYFGREIGLMYMHAHLRYAQALAHLGETERFFHALCQANPVGLRSLIESAALRQSNCYYSSSDAAFADRYEARAQYQRLQRADVALEGGWRVYSSGPGVALGLIVRRLLGFVEEHDALIVDPVIPAQLDGMRAWLSICGRQVEAIYELRGQGSGVARVEINGAEAVFQRDSHPYRSGAARIAMCTAASLLRAGENTVKVWVG